MKYVFLLVLLLTQTVLSFESNELAMFDLAEELGMTFYEFLGVEQDASSAEIKRAYRKLSLQYHPDKNPGNEEIAAKFRKLSGVYAVLKEEDSRQQYNDVLEYGLPDWRQPVFYYRQLRKMTNFELMIVICLIFICIHYSAIWGIAYEKRWAFEEQLNTAYKKHKLSGKKLESVNKQIKEDLQQVPLPGFFDILPFAIVKGCISIGKSIPVLFTMLLSSFSKSDDDLKTKKKDKLPPKKSKELKERKNATNSSKKDDVKEASLNPRACKGLEDIQTESTPSVDHWTSAEKQDLIRAINATPNTSSKWTKIAQALKKELSEVILVARQLLAERKAFLGLDDFSQTTEAVSSFEVNENSTCFDDEENPNNVAINQENEIEQEDQDEESITADDTHVSHRKFKLIEDEQSNELKENDKLWSKQEHQKLEAALKIYTKDSASSNERWLSIADYIGTKNCEEVMLRCKLISTNCRRKNAKMFV